MKKLAFLLTLLILLVGMVFYPTQNTFAQTPNPTQTPTLAASSVATAGEQSENTISLSSIGVKDVTMRGPYDSMDASFSTPADWQLSDGAQIELTMDARYFYASTGVENPSIVGGGATIDVTFNNVAVTTIPVDWVGEKTITVPIPIQALSPSMTDGRHNLNLFLDAAIDCFLDSYETTIVIRSGSKIILPHSQGTPSPTLAAFPRPLYVESSFSPVPVRLIVPEDPSAEELQAALSVSAGLGRMTAGNIPLTITTESQLTNEDRMGAHFIYVGKAASFPSIKGVTLPAPSDGNQFNASGLAGDDGVIQVTNSPYTNQRLMYVVGGNTDTGVIKAGQALSAGTIRTTSTPNLAIISDVQQSILSTTVSENRTLADLGYQNVTVSGIGVQPQTYQFYVPLGQVAADGAYFDLVFNHSALLDFERSGIVVLVNDQTVGAVKYSDLNTQITTVRITLPSYVIHSGDNTLTVEADMTPTNLCSEFINNGLWTSIINTSLLHLPLVAATAEKTTPLSIASYPLPFTSSPTLNSVSFVLPKNDPISWNIASRLAIELGSRTFGSLVNLKAMYENLPEDQKTNYDLIVIGKATTLPIISELSTNLPAPFENGSNVATEKGFPIVYRIPEGSDLGYIEWCSSPWNANRVIMAILGSTDQGLEWAGNAMLKPELRSRIGGDFVVARYTQVLSSNTKYSASAGLSATLVPAEAVVNTLTPTKTVKPAGNPAWIIPAIIVISLIILIVIIYAAIPKKSNKS